MKKNFCIFELLSYFIIIISFNLLIYLSYRALLPHTSVKYYLFYILITLVFILIFLFTINLKRVQKVIFYTFFSFFLFSIYFVEYIFLNYDFSLINSSIKNVDFRSRYKVYNDLNNNSDAVVEVIPSYYIYRRGMSPNFTSEIFPLSGISNSLTIGCNESGFHRTYQSDKFGFNNLNNVWQKNIDYLLIGDSFVHGACVNRPHDIASVISNNYNLNVANLGYGGNGPLIELATLKEYYKENTKNIVWFFFEGNDFGNLKNELFNKLLSRYLSDDIFTQNLKNKQETINIISQNTINNEFKNQFINFLKLSSIRASLNKFYSLFNSNNVRSFEKVDKKTFSKFEKIMIKAKMFADNKNSNFYFFLIPHYGRFEADQKNLDKLDYNKKKIKSFLKNNEIVYFDIYENLFKNYNREDIYTSTPHYHFNKKGYNLLGKYIYKEVNK